MSKSRSKSSTAWLKEHFSDPYVKEAQRLGLRSRAAFKLIEIQKKDRIIKPGMTVVDLGSAPGGWSQYAAQEVGKNGCVIASDILPMDELDGVEFIQGDFTENDVLKKIMDCVENEKVDLVISDMAPNLSGIQAVDQSKSMYLSELALDLAQQILKKTGQLYLKSFKVRVLMSFYLR